MIGRTLAVLALGMALLGCKPAEGPSQSAPAQQQGSGIIDTMTQKSKVEAGKKAAAKVREVGEEQQKDLDQIMGE